MPHFATICMRTRDEEGQKEARCIRIC